MKTPPIKSKFLMLFSLALLLFFSCTKDADLFDEHISENFPEDETETGSEMEIIDSANAKIELEEDRRVSVNLLDAVSDTGKSRKLKSVDEPYNGNIQLRSKTENTIEVVPNEDFNGEDAFDFTLEITQEDNSIVIQEVKVNVIVNPVADATEDTVDLENGPTVMIDVLDNDTFENKDNVVVSDTSTPLYGEVTIDENSMITYTQNTEESNADAFTYTAQVTNADGTVTEEEATVKIAIGSSKDPSGSVGGELKAFPTAYGAGAYATGGRGGSVYYVTNLNNSGQGSFRDAVSQSNRIVVFSVAGIIQLQSLVSIASNITIAGQTAPAGGITISGERVIIENSENIIIRYLRFRGRGSSDQDSFTGLGGANVIFDHCSFSFGSDEVWSFVSDDKRCDNITFQNNLVAEGKTGVLVGAVQPQDYSTAGAMSYLRNVIYNISHRSPNVNGDARFDVINNLHWNATNRLVRANGGIKLNHINNYSMFNFTPNNNNLNSYSVEKFNIAPEIYTAGNLILPNALTDPNADNWSTWKWFLEVTTGNYAPQERFDQLTTDFKMNTPFGQLGAPMDILTAQQVYEQLPDAVGANARLNENGVAIDNRDAEDSMYVSKIKSGSLDASFRAYDALQPEPFVGGTANLDTDGDGMPDAWERANGLDPTRQDHNEDPDDDGYTNIEEFINLVDI